MACPGPWDGGTSAWLGRLRLPRPAAYQAALLAVPGGGAPACDPQLPRAQDQCRAGSLHAPLAARNLLRLSREGPAKPELGSRFRGSALCLLSPWKPFLATIRPLLAGSEALSSRRTMSLTCSCPLMSRALMVEARTAPGCQLLSVPRFLVEYFLGLQSFHSIYKGPRARQWARWSVTSWSLQPSGEETKSKQRRYKTT